MKNSIFSIAVLLVSFINSYATVINVPTDIDSIQGAINLASVGDTVLVHPGTYYENINFNGKNITVGSLFLTTGDTSYISNTTIDGDSSGSVVIFENGEDSTALLTGFNIIHGSGTPNSWGVTYGGGIYVKNSGPKLVHLIINQNNCNEGGGIACIKATLLIKNNIIKNNIADPYWGGGIMCQSSNGFISDNIIINNHANAGGGLEIYSGSSPQISGNVIRNNTVNSIGGGIILYTRCSPLMNNNIIDNNNASGGGGGMFLHMGSNPILVNNSIINNSASTGGAIYSRFGSHPILINSILWNNTPQEIFFSFSDDSNSISSTYSDIKDGENNIAINNNGRVFWLTGNIDADPVFVDTANGNYRLQADSPCIDAGIAFFEFGGDTLINLHPWQYNGSAPDMGAYEFGPPLGINEEQHIPSVYTLSQNYPNPFNPSTKINYILPKTEKVKIEVFNLSGQKIKTLINKQISAGIHEVEFTAKNLPSGVYMYRIEAGEFQEAKKMILLK